MSDLRDCLDVRGFVENVTSVSCKEATDASNIMDIVKTLSIRLFSLSRSFSLLPLQPLLFFLFFHLRNLDI